MSTFWLAASAMTVIAVMFAVVPLLRNRADTTIDHDEINTAVIREQLKELEEDLAAGKLDEDSYTAARRDLERELLDDVKADTESTSPAAGSGKWAIGLVGVLIPAMAVMIYLQLGVTEIPERQVPVKAAPSANGMDHPMAAMVEKLAERLQQEPDNAEGWMLLGRSYATLNQFDNAAAAYEQALRLTGDHPQVLTDFADMRIMANGGQFTAESVALLERALAVDADNPKAMWLMGHWKYQNNDYRAALDYWQRTSAQLPPNSENAIAINQQIRQAQQKLGIAAVPATPATPQLTAQTQAASAHQVSVSVSLDADLAAKASPQDTVFIFARAVSGPRMPLAIVRKQVSDLPVTVTLDDSMAMTPAMVLSKFPEVTIGARVSKSGNAIAAAGDLQGEVSPVRIAEQNAVNVLIDTLVP